MMLINKLRADKALSYFLKENCCDEGICVDFDPTIPAEDIVIIKVDDFYADAIRTNDRPKSPDCLIVQHCKDGHYHWYLIELRNRGKKNGQDLKQEVWDKFHTCLTDFMSDRFREYFYDTSFGYKLHLVLVAGKRSEKFNRNYDFKFLLALNPLWFGGKRIAIQGENPNPLIRPC